MLGCCGESHPSIFYLMGLTPFMIFLRYQINVVYRGTILSLKSLTSRVLRYHYRKKKP